jgi:hypothetical protein
MRLRFSRSLLIASLAIVSSVATAQDDEAINPVAKFMAMAARLPAYDVVSIHQNVPGAGDSSCDTTGDGSL